MNKFHHMIFASTVLAMSAQVCPAVEWSWTGAASSAFQAHFYRDGSGGVAGFHLGSPLASQAGLKASDFELEHVHVAINAILNDRFSVNVSPCIEHEGTLSIRLAYLEAAIIENGFETLLSAEVGRFLVPFGRFNSFAEVTTFPTVSRPMMFASHDQDIVIFPDFAHPVFMSQYSEIGITLNGSKWFGEKHQLWYGAWVGNGLYQEGFTGHSHGGAVGHVMTAMGLSKSAAVKEAGHDSGFTLPTGNVNGVAMSATSISWLQKTRFSTDNNGDKAVGARLSYGYGQLLSLGVSYMGGKYDPADMLEYRAMGADLSLDIPTSAGRVQLSGEYVYAPTQYAAYNDTSSWRINIGTYVTSGWYGQGVWSFHKGWEAVAVYDALMRTGPEVKYQKGAPLLQTGADEVATLTTKLSAGINFSPIEHVKIKAEYAYFMFDHLTMAMRVGELHRLSGALVLSF